MRTVRASELEIRRNFDDVDFLQENHYQGYIPSTINYGLFDGDELIIDMTFGVPRFNKRYDWELLRLCTKKDCIVHGGASRLWKHFLEENVGSIISYCNESKFSGNVYNELGFTKRGVCNSYHYEKDGKKYLRYSMQRNANKRARGEKENIQKTIESFGGTYYADKNELENATLNGMVKVDEIQATWTYGDHWYIYRITDTRNNKTYIGQHLDRGDDYYGSGTIIRRIIAKYGTSILKKEIIVDNIQSQKEADELELYYINLEKPEYNIVTSKYMPSIHTPNSQPRTEETKKRISEAKQLHPWQPTDEQRKRMSEAQKGKHHTEETKKKISENSAHYKYWEGKKMSEEHKRKISEGNKGRVFSEESRKKISEALKGKKHPVKETKRMQWKKMFMEQTGKSEVTFKRWWKLHKDDLVFQL